MKKRIITTGLIIIIVLIITLARGGDKESNSGVVDSASDNVKESTIVISPQETVSVVKVGEITLEKPGFIAIHEVINEKPGQVLEVSRYLSIGIHRDVEIALGKRRQSKQIDISSGFPVTNELVAVVYVDDGDEGFNPNLDSILESDGKILARYVESGASASKSVVVPGAQEKSDDVAVKITYTDEGFSPNIIEINRGETVEFINQSRRPMWVASNEHPAHGILPTFDQFTVSGFGTSWQYTFDQVGEWVYHDHVNASMEGTVIVQ